MIEIVLKSIADCWLYFDTWLIICCQWPSDSRYFINETLIKSDVNWYQSIIDVERSDLQMQRVTPYAAFTDIDSKSMD